MKKLFLSSLAINILVIGLNLLTGILSARYLGALGRGELAIATRWTHLFILLFTFGLPGALTYLGKKYQSDQSSYLSSYLILNAIIGPIGLIIGFLVFPFLFSQHSKEILHIAQISLLSLPFGIISNGLIGSLQGLNKFGYVMILRVLTPLGTLLIILSLLVLGNYNVMNFIIIFTILNIIICLISLIFVLKYLKPKFSNFTHRAKTLTKRGLQIFGYNLTSSFGNQFDQLIISLVLSPYILGLYTVAISIRNMIVSVIHGAINVYLMPKLMDLDDNARINKVQRVHGILFYSTLFAATIVSLTLPIMIPLIYGNEFVNSVTMAIILLLSVPFTIGNGVLVSFLSSEARFHSITLSEIISLGCGILTTFLLFSLLGGEAASVGILLSAFTKWFFNIYMGAKRGIKKLALFYLYIDSFRSILHSLFRKKSPFTSNSSYEK